MSPPSSCWSSCSLCRVCSLCSWSPPEVDPIGAGWCWLRVPVGIDKSLPKLCVFVVTLITRFSTDPSDCDQIRPLVGIGAEVVDEHVAAVLPRMGLQRKYRTTWLMSGRLQLLAVCAGLVLGSRSSGSFPFSHLRLAT